MGNIFQISSMYLMTYGTALTGSTRTRSHASARRLDVEAAVDVAAVAIVVAEEAAVADTRTIEIAIIPMEDVDVDLVEAAMDEDMVETDEVAAMTTTMDQNVDSTSRIAMPITMTVDVTIVT